MCEKRKKNKKKNKKKKTKKLSQCLKSHISGTFEAISLKFGMCNAEVGGHVHSKNRRVSSRHHRATKVRKLRFLSSCQYTHGCCAPASGPHDTLQCVLIILLFYPPIEFGSQLSYFMRAKPHSANLTRCHLSITQKIFHHQATHGHGLSHGLQWRIQDGAFGANAPPPSRNCIQDRDTLIEQSITLIIVIKQSQC